MGHRPLPNRRNFTACTMWCRLAIEYYSAFRPVILVLGVGYQCVPLPFAVGLNPLDLHALDTPPAFILSQDQTLIYDRKDKPGFQNKTLNASSRPPKLADFRQPK